MKIPDCVSLEMKMAELMALQEASGFKFDMDAAERVRQSLACEAKSIEEKISAIYNYYPGKVFVPKRTSAKTGYVAGSPMTKLVDFNPTSRLHIHWALTTFRGARFTKVTDSGKPKVDEATLSEVRDQALAAGNTQLHQECEMFIRLLTLQKHMGQLSQKVLTLGSIPLSLMVVSITAVVSLHRQVVTLTVVLTSGKLSSAPWARELFVPFPGHVMVGADLEGIELRALGHYLARFDEGAFAEVVCNGDIHQQNADRVGCTRPEVKTLTYAFIYGAGDAKLGHSLHPEYSDAQKKALGNDLRRKFLDAIPGLEPLINAVKLKVRETGKLKGLDGRPIFCDGEHKALNFLLQSCGAIISKRWCVISQELLDNAGLTYDSDYTRCAYVHDEQQFSVLPSEAERVARLLVEAAPLAGQYYKFKVPITAASDIGDSWAATH